MTHIYYNPLVSSQSTCTTVGVVIQNGTRTVAIVALFSQGQRHDPRNGSVESAAEVQMNFRNLPVWLCLWSHRREGEGRKTGEGEQQWASGACTGVTTGEKGIEEGDNKLGSRGETSRR